METKTVPTGNSRDKPHSKIIHPGKASRAGWADAFKQMAATGDDHMVHEDVPPAIHFDQEEWQW
jgi:hypothetical protein